MRIDSALIERIYEAAVVPDALMPAMQEVAALVGCKGMIVNFVGEQVRFLPTPGVERLVEEYMAGGYTGNEVRVEDVYRQWYPGFLPESTYRTAAELYALPIYRDFLIPRGCFGACATPVQGVADSGVYIAAEGF